MTPTSDWLVPIGERLGQIAARHPHRPALISKARPGLSYGSLAESVAGITSDLRSFGLTEDNRIAVVATPGPELAVAILGICAGNPCIPLNPKLARGDWEYLFSSFQVSALVFDTEVASAARQTAEAMGIPVIEMLRSENGAVGDVRLQEVAPIRSRRPTVLREDRLAFILPTSGTTSNPKPVPLTHLNIAQSTWNMAQATQLTPHDRLLNILPLHHSYGLISGLMTSIYAGASVICHAGFQLDAFVEALQSDAPTCMMGVPTMFSEILAHASTEPGWVPDTKLRLIHSSASPLPADRIIELEKLFSAPVIETYGMTEAASQITSNPMPPGERRLNSVGRPAGPDLKVVDQDRKETAPRVAGEIVIRGDNLMAGYEGFGKDPDNWTADGWFRTGDFGFQDEDGYLFITGRVKEFINRGGEKISPVRIEDVLLSHPDVREAAAFPMPHARLGEDVGAAVVVDPTSKSTPGDLRAFATLSGRLSENQIPRRIILVSAIPKTATGKLQRLRLARQLLDAGTGSAGNTARNAEFSETAWRLAQIWTEILGVELRSLEDDFFALGGDSLSAVRLLLKIDEEFAVRLDLESVFNVPTIAQQAVAIDALRVDTIDEMPGATSGPAEQGAPSLTVSQRKMLETASAVPELPIYNIPSVFRLSGPIDALRFNRAINGVISRHEALRTTFALAQGAEAAVVQPAGAVEISVDVEDWSLVTRTRRDDFIQDVAHHESWAVLDLGTAPLFRVRVLSFGERDHVLILTFHHLIVDAWSMDAFFEDLTALYAASPAQDACAAPQLAGTFTAFAKRQRSLVDSHAEAAARAFWRDQLAGREALFLDAEHPADREIGFSASRETVEISASLIDRVELRARDVGATLFMVLLASLKIALARSLSRWDFAVLTPAANRTDPQNASVIGLVQNHVPIHAGLRPEMTYAQALAAVRAAVLAAQKHEALPFEAIAADIETTIEVCFSLLRNYGQTLRLPGLGVKPWRGVPHQGQPVLPIDGVPFFLTLVDTEDGVFGSCAYKDRIVGSDRIERVLNDFQQVLTSIADEPLACIGESLAVSSTKG